MTPLSMEAIDEPIKTIGTTTLHSIFNQMQLVSKPRRNDAFAGYIAGIIALAYIANLVLGK